MSGRVWPALWAGGLMLLSGCSPAANFAAGRPGSDSLVVALRPGSPPAAGRSGSGITASASALEGEPVQVSGEGPLGDVMTATGFRTEDGSVELRDTTLPSYDPGTGQGVSVTHDAGDSEEIPGPVSTFQSTEVTDPEALAAHAFSRYILDFYRQVFGRNSWDGQDGTLTSVVNHSPAGDDDCTAFFTSAVEPALMVYGNPCVRGGEERLRMLDADVAAHEITHGVTATSSNLRYSGQSGALNESFSDYFGNVIGDHWKGRDTTALGDGQCEGIPNSDCSTTSQGEQGVRDMLNGNGLSEYLYLLDTPLALQATGFDVSDNGGVHYNSGIWDNALTSIRVRLARIDGTSARESVRAQNFDQAVYATLTQRLGPTSGFLDAAAALEESAIQLGLDPESIEIIRETLVLNDLCRGCVEPAAAVGRPLDASIPTQKSPVTSAGRVAWMDFAQGEVTGSVVYGTAEGAEGVVPTGGYTYAAGFAGDAVVTLEADTSAGAEVIVRYDLASGDRDVVSESPYYSHFLAVASSPEGAGWADVAAAEVGHVDDAGSVERASYADLDVATVTAVGAGGGTVALGGADGELVVWQVGSKPQVLDPVDGAVLAVDAHGSHVLAVGSDGVATLHDLKAGERTVVSERAQLGAALSADMAVWGEAVASLGGGLAELYGSPWTDTDLYGYDLRNGETIALVEQRGQQGFPDVAGDRLVWQDAVNGGDDIYEMELP